MNKPLFVFSGPVDTFSGYGARARDLVKAILNSNKYDLKIISQGWGRTPFGFLKQDNPDDKQMLDLFIKDGVLPRKPDIWAQCTVPNEFQAIGEYNIGFTAGIETTLCDVSWIDGMNKMDITFVSSEHSKQILTGTTYQKRDKNNIVIDTVKVNKPVEVLFEGVDLDIFTNKYNELSLNDVNPVLDTIEEDFCFLFVGHWLQGDMGQDRKDVGMLIKTFLETFKNKPKKPALILKTNGASYSVLDRDEVLIKIQKIKKAVGGNIPKIYLIHGELTDIEMNELNNHPKVKAMVSFTKGEGFGRPLLEFSVTGKPVIAPNYSGHLDFLKDNSILLDGELKQIHKNAVVPNLLIPESSWFEVNYGSASKVLEKVYENYKDFLGSAKKQSYLSKTRFSLNKMEEELISKLDKITPKVIELKIPKLIKIENE